MNKKGMTLVEIIVAISLISVVMIFLFQVLITVTNGNKRNNTKSKTLISKTLITKAVEHDLDAFGLNDPSASIINCSNNIDPSTINQIIPASARSDYYYCVKLTYNENNIKNNEGYLLFYKNNDKSFLAYKRGKGNVLETQIVREIDAYPTEPSGNIYKLVQEDDIFTLKIDIPIIAEDGNNYDLTINYISSNTINEASPSPEEPEITCTKTFAEENNWEIIKKCVNKCINNIGCDTSVYSSLDKTAEDKQKTVTIDGKNYTVRIANDSHYDCKDDSGNILESKTACGFVVEFVDIVEQRPINSIDTNVGGWLATAMRTYLNGEFLAKLPSDLQGVIAETTVISGHGNSDSANFTSTDKIYLLSAREVWIDGSSNKVSSYDTAYTKTRQLDYYENLGVTTNKYSGAIKQYNSSNAWWWLREAFSADTYAFLSVDVDGNWINPGADGAYGGVAPAFRIGDYE